jgi:nucleoside-diphosphate-sugar epimerase
MARTVLVTGAAGGIGRATVAYLQSTGANVLEVDLRGVPYCCDLTDHEARVELIQTLQSSVASLDAVIPAAGMLHGAPAAVVAANFFGTTRLLEGLRPLLVKSASPRALVISSISSRYPCDGGVSGRR